MNQNNAPCGGWLLAMVLGICCVGSVGAQGCGDCDGSGAISILDALSAAQVSIGLRAPLPSLGWACDVNDNGHISIVDALLIARSALGTGPALACQPSGAEFAYALFSVQDLRFDQAIFTDSYDSTAGYAPAPTSAPFTTPFDSSRGGVGSNGYLWLASGQNEIHGALEFGATRWASVGGAQEASPAELASSVQFPPVDQATLDDASVSNSNALIDGESTLDAAAYLPGQTAYDPLTNSLDARGAGTTVRLGDPGQSPRVYYFSSISASDGGKITFVGPTTVVLVGDLTLDPADGVQNLLHAGVVPDLYIFCSSQVTVVELEGPLAAILYAPESLLRISSPVEVFGSLVVGSVDPASVGPLLLHYDVNLGFDYP